MADLLKTLFNGKGLVFYYALLLIVMMSWTDFSSFPPMPLRIVYMCLVLLPALIDRNGLMPATLTCFWGIAINGYAYSYMPTMSYLIIIVLIIAYPFVRRTGKPSFMYNGMYIPVILCVMLALRDIIADLEIQDNASCFLILSLLPAYICEWDTNAHNKMELAFMTLSLALSFFCFTTQELFAGDYGTFGGETRSGWTDPNYLSMTMGMGAVIAFRKLINYKSINIPTRILSVASLLATFPAMLTLASRGGVLCFGVATMIILSFSKTSKFFKIIFVICVACFIVFLYTNSFFDILEARLDSEDSTGSERTIIWESRLNAFVNSYNPLLWLFGHSYHGGLHLGWSYEFGSHNDYIAFLSEYGIIGLVLFLCMITLPILILKQNSKQKIEVFAYTAFLLLSCATLEPFTLGRPVFFLFWFYIILLARLSQQQSIKLEASRQIAEILKNRQIQKEQSKKCQTTITINE